MIDINKELFKRYKPENKKTIVENLSETELFSITPSTLLRIIKEVGTGSSLKQRSRFKTVRLQHRIGNNRNSTITELFNGKNNSIWLDVYIQGDDTDTSDSCDIKEFLSSYNTVTCGTLTESFRNGYSHTISAQYDKEDRAKVIREILLTYINLKYNTSE